MTTPTKERPEPSRSAVSERIRRTPELWAFEDTIMASWDDSAEHWRWLATAPVAAIVAWAEKVSEPLAE